MHSCVSIFASFARRRTLACAPFGMSLREPKKKGKESYLRPPNTSFHFFERNRVTESMLTREEVLELVDFVATAVHCQVLKYRPFPLFIASHFHPCQYVLSYILLFLCLHDIFFCFRWMRTLDRSSIWAPSLSSSSS